jgi:serine/threonine-protein kinase
MTEAPASRTRPASTPPAGAIYDAGADAAVAAELADERRVVIDDDVATGTLLAADTPRAQAPEARRPRRWRRRLVLLVVVLLLAGGGAAAAVGKPWLKTVSVPDVTGLTTAEAAVRLKPERLKARVTAHEYSETVEAGRILSFRPARAKQDSSVGVSVSDGPEPRTIPPARGKTLAEVQPQLEALGLRLKVVRKDDAAAPVDVVLDTDPPANLQATRGSEVTVTVSDGPAAKPVPDVTGKPYEEAAAALTAAGFVPSRTDAFSDTVPAGNVVSSAPAPATALKPGKPVALTVSKGPDLVTVPTVAGSAPADAQAALQAAGLGVSATYGPPSGKVFDTDPKQGTKVKRGSAVALYTR